MNKFLFYVILLLFLQFVGCNSDRTSLDNTHLGGCILIDPVADLPSDIYQMTSITETNEYEPFNKKLTVCGIILIGRDDISDDFMQKVAETIKEIFSPNGENINKDLQEDLIINMYKYRTVIPLFKGENFDFTSSDEELWDRTTRENSICDIIMEGVPGQVTEVVEHILHFVTDIGMHYTFPDEWGISKSSKLYELMQQAIDNQYYDVAQYSDIDNDADRLRVLLQEYAYWIIYTSWDLREPYGPQEAEWSIMSSSELNDKLPQSYQLFQKIVPKVMVRPSKEMLESFIN
jgi:hypothetical protein|tara:strand:- start:3056 stop:3925 length:870 start_codon:yes stop_codon:yes gene_type:complete